MPVHIDVEKITYGLEKGVPKTGTPFSYLPEKYIMRGSPCGLVTAGISTYLRKRGIPHQTPLSRFQLPWATEPIQHVFPVLDEGEVCIDASYSQFFAGHGLEWQRERKIKRNAFPSEKLISFRVEEINEIADWMAEVSLQFCRQYPTVPDQWAAYTGDKLAPRLSRVALGNIYKEIWSGGNWHAWNWPNYAFLHGEIIAREIPEGAIIVT